MEAKTLTDSIKSTWVKSLIADLGWDNLQRHSHVVPSEASSAISGSTLVWYEAGSVGDPRTDCFLQVNELDVDEGALFCSGAVYALRYRICTGWHVISLTADPSQRSAESDKLAEWLHRRHFEQPSARRDFRAIHPETVGYTWKRIRSDGPPYFVEAKRAGEELLVEQKRAQQSN